MKRNSLPKRCQCMQFQYDLFKLEQVETESKELHRTNYLVCRAKHLSWVVELCGWMLEKNLDIKCYASEFCEFAVVDYHLHQHKYHLALNLTTRRLFYMYHILFKFHKNLSSYGKQDLLHIKNEVHGQKLDQQYLSPIVNCSSLNTKSMKERNSTLLLDQTWKTQKGLIFNVVYCQWQKMP